MTDENTTDDPDEQGEFERRLDRLETQLAAQQETIEHQQARIEEQAAIIETQREQLDDDDEADVLVNRRTALKAGGVLGLLGVGAGTAAADPSGQIGTSSDPLNKLYTEELNGGVTGDTSLTNIAGNGLSIDNSGNLKTSGGNSTSKLETSGNTALEVVDGGTNVSDAGSSIDAPNIVGGHPDNTTNSTSPKGVTISGGGSDGTFHNIASANYATVGGGQKCEATDKMATVSGGNTNEATKRAATVSGGELNSAKADAATVVGGDGNDAEGQYSTVFGGKENQATTESAVAAGHKNSAIGGKGAAALGGISNRANSKAAVAVGGENNDADANHALVAGRSAESNGNAGSFVWGDSSSTTVTAGAADEVRFQATGGFVVENGNVDAQGGTVENTTSGGLTVKTNDNGNLTLNPGSNNELSLSNQSTNSSGSLLAINNGNVVEASSTTLSDVGGVGSSISVDNISDDGSGSVTMSSDLELGGNALKSSVFEVQTQHGPTSYSRVLELGAKTATSIRGDTGSATSLNIAGNVVAGHPNNEVQNDADGVVISGGGGDSGFKNVVAQNGGVVGGGVGNEAGEELATVAGGQNNAATGIVSTIPGGEENTADGKHSFAAGRKADTNTNDGAFVWGDSSSTAVTAGATDEVRFQATGGFVVENGTVDAQGGTVENTTGGLTVQSSGSNDITLSPGGDVDLSGTLDATDNNIKTSSGDLTLNPYNDVVITPTGNDYEPLRVTDKAGNEFLVADIGNNRLQVFDDDASNHLRIRHTGTNAEIEAPNAGDNLELTANGNVVVKDVLRPDDDELTDLGASSNAWKDIYSKNAVTTSSDARLKDTVSDLTDGYEKVRSMRPVSYKWAEESDSDTHLGFLAQEIEEIVPEVVDRPDDEGGHLSLRYQELIPVVVSALQEQQSISSDLEANLDAKDARIEDLEAESADLEAESADLEAENEALRERNADLEDRLATVEAELGIDATASQQGVADD